MPPTDDEVAECEDDPDEESVELGTRVGMLMDSLLFEAEKPDLLNFVLRAHLGIQSALVGLIRYSVPNTPKKLRIGYTASLDLGVALSLIPESLVPPLEYLNDMRNGLAHNDEYVLNDEKATNLYERLDDKLQLNVQLMEQSLNEGGFPARLRFGVAYLYAEVVERFILLKARREGESVETVMW